MAFERRVFDTQIEMVINKIDNLEKKMDSFVNDFKHQCEIKHLALDEYIRKASDKIPVDTCNRRMGITERIVSRHTVYWGILIFSISISLTIIGLIFDKIAIK